MALRSDKQMDIKLFTEFLQKKRKIRQKTWLLWETHFPLMVKVSSLKTFGLLPVNTSMPGWLSGERV